MDVLDPSIFFLFKEIRLRYCEGFMGEIKRLSSTYGALSNGIELLPKSSQIDGSRIKRGDIEKIMNKSFEWGERIGAWEKNT